MLKHRNTQRLCVKPSSCKLKETLAFAHRFLIMCECNSLLGGDHSGTPRCCDVIPTSACTCGERVATSRVDHRGGVVCLTIRHVSGSPGPEAPRCAALDIPTQLLQPLLGSPAEFYKQHVCLVFIKINGKEHFL